MYNPNFFRSSNSDNEEDRALNEGLVSIVGDDYLLNFLNDAEPTSQPRQVQTPHVFNQMYYDQQAPFNGFQEQPKPQENFNNLYGKMNMQGNWMYQNPNEQNKMQYGIPPSFNFKVENPEEINESKKQKKLKVDKDSGLSIQSVPEAPSKPKGNIKNTYINKISTLISEKPEENLEVQIPVGIVLPEARKPPLVKHETESQSSLSTRISGMKKVRSYDVLKPDELQKLNVKLVRNRESARKSRKRKKVYIDLLEKKVDQLQQELDSTTKQLEQNSSSLNKFNTQNNLMHNLYSGEQQLYEKLEKMLSNRSDETEISFLIDSLRLRLGANGKERVNAINFFFKQILEFIVPVHMKYLLRIAVEGKDVFSSKDTNLLNNLPPNLIGKENLQNETTEYWYEIANQLNFTDNQKKSVSRYRKKLVGEKQKLESLVRNLYQVRKGLLKQTKSLQDVVDEVSSIFSPSQFGKLLITLDKEKDQKDFSFEKLWVNPTKKENGEEASDDSDDFFQTENNEQLGRDEDNKGQQISELVPSFDRMQNLKSSNVRK